MLRLVTPFLSIPRLAGALKRQTAYKSTVKMTMSTQMRKSSTKLSRPAAETSMRSVQSLTAGQLIS